MIDQELNELQKKSIEISMQVAQLATQDALKIIGLIADLAARLKESATAVLPACRPDPQELMIVRSQYEQQTARQMITTAAQIAAVGGATRTSFSRLLTEQLASGSFELLDEFQAFFRVLPPSAPILREAIQHAMVESHDALEQTTRLAAAMNRSETLARTRRLSKKARAATRKPVVEIPAFPSVASAP